MAGRLVDEARVQACVAHRNVARIHGLYEVGDERFILMEYVEGRSLRDLFRLARSRASVQDEVELLDHRPERFRGGVVPLRNGRSVIGQGHGGSRIIVQTIDDDAPEDSRPFDAAKLPAVADGVENGEARPAREFQGAGVTVVEATGIQPRAAEVAVRDGGMFPPVATIHPSPEVCARQPSRKPAAPQ